MTSYALVAGTLFRAPEQRTSKAGKPFATATIKASKGEAVEWWRVAAFSESAQAELMRLCDGDSLSVQGVLKAEIYERDDGEKRLSLSIVADHILALRQPTKSRAAKTRGTWSGPADGPNDSLDDLSF